MRADIDLWLPSAKTANGALLDPTPHDLLAPWLEIAQASVSGRSANSEMGKLFATFAQFDGSTGIFAV